MPIVKIVKYTGVVCAIDVIESNQKRIDEYNIILEERHKKKNL